MPGKTILLINNNRFSEASLRACATYLNMFDRTSGYGPFEYVTDLVRPYNSRPDTGIVMPDPGDYNSGSIEYCRGVALAFINLSFQAPILLDIYTPTATED